MYTVREVAEKLKVNRNYIYDVINKGELKAVKIGSIKVRKIDLENFIKEREIIYVNKNR